MAYLEFKNLKINNKDVISNFTIKINKSNIVTINNNCIYSSYLFNLFTTNSIINDTVFKIGDNNYNYSNINEYRKYVSILSGDLVLFDNLSVIDNINLYSSCQSLINKYINYFKFNKKKNILIKNLNKQDKQKVLIIRLLSKKTNVFIIEDILNKTMKNKVIELIKQLNKTNIIIMLSSDKKMLDISDKIIEFKNNKLVSKQKMKSGDTDE